MATEKIAVVAWNVARKVPEIHWEQKEADNIGIDTNRVVAVWMEKMAEKNKKGG